MKGVIIIDSYANTPERLGCLESCIDRLSTYPIMLVSHLPIPTHIQEKVKYCIYDRENTLLPPEITPLIWFGNESFYFEKYSQGHQLAICRSMQSSISLAQAAGYDLFHFIEFDNLFHPDDLGLLADLERRMEEENKQLYFFNNQGDKIYETLIFGGQTQYFLHKANLPSTVEQYVKWVSETDHYSETLERSFYRVFDEREKYLEIPSTSEQFFSKSEINKHSTTGVVCEVVPNNLDARCVLFLNNPAGSQKPVEFRVGEDIMVYSPGFWSYRFLEPHTELVVNITIDGEMTERRFLIPEGSSGFSDKGLIRFH